MATCRPDGVTADIPVFGKDGRLMSTPPRKPRFLLPAGDVKPEDQPWGRLEMLRSRRSAIRPMSHRGKPAAVRRQRRTGAH